MTNKKVILLSVLSGIFISSLFSALAFYVGDQGYEKMAMILYWPGIFLVNLVPLHNIGSSQSPFYEWTPIHFAALATGYPLGILVYSIVTYVCIKIYRKCGRWGRDCSKQ